MRSSSVQNISRRREPTTGAHSRNQCRGGGQLSLRQGRTATASFGCIHAGKRGPSKIISLAPEPSAARARESARGQGFVPSRECRGFEFHKCTKRLPSRVIAFDTAESYADTFLSSACSPCRKGVFDRRALSSDGLQQVATQSPATSTAKHPHTHSQTVIMDFS